MAIDLQLASALGDLNARLASFAEQIRARPAADGQWFAIDHAEITALIAQLADARAPARLADVATQPRNESAVPSSGLARLASIYGLSDFETMAVVLALAVEIDPRYGRLVAYFNDHAARQRPTVGLALALFPVAPDARQVARSSFAPSGALRRYALLEVLGEGPFADRSIRVSEPVWPRLVGGSSRSAGKYRASPQRSLSELAMADEQRGRVAHVAELLRHRAQQAPAVLLRGPSGSGRSALAGALAAAIDLGTLEVSARVLFDPDKGPAVVRDAMWHDAALVVLVDDPDTSRETPRHFPLEVPSFWISEQSLHDAVRTATIAAPLGVEVTRPTPAIRAALWLDALGSQSSGTEIDVHALAARYRFGPQRIYVAAALAAARAKSLDEGARALSMAELMEICRELPANSFAGLAERMPCPYVRDDLVVSQKVWRELELAKAWVDQGVRVLDEWGLRRKVPNASSLSCLFTGSPGTGKTMAAQVLARELGLDVYRIDLSRVVSKYIGETESNLSKVFDAAEECNAILFFDEADVLFGKRTEIKDAHDRFANIEVGYLLQRLETHEGVCILATNLRSNLDAAFTRRLQIIAHFEAPGARERLAIWRRLLMDAPTADDVDLEFLAERFALVGGEIRNAVLTACFLASREGDTVGMRDLVVGLWRELDKEGRIVDPKSLGPWRDAVLTYARGESPSS